MCSLTYTLKLEHLHADIPGGGNKYVWIGRNTVTTQHEDS